MTVRVSQHHCGQTLYLSLWCGIPPLPLHPPLKNPHMPLNLRLHEPRYCQTPHRELLNGFEFENRCFAKPLLCKPVPVAFVKTMEARKQWKKQFRQPQTRGFSAGFAEAIETTDMTKTTGIRGATTGSRKTGLAKPDHIVKTDEVKGGGSTSHGLNHSAWRMIGLACTAVL